jgi:hypothetical protein
MIGAGHIATLTALLERADFFAVSKKRSPNHCQRGSDGRALFFVAEPCQAMSRKMVGSAMTAAIAPLS